MTLSGPYHAQPVQGRFDAIPADHSKHESGLRQSSQSFASGGSRDGRSITAGADDAKPAGRRRALTFKLLPKKPQSIKVVPNRQQAAAESKGRSIFQVKTALSSTAGLSSMQLRVEQAHPAPQVATSLLLLGGLRPEDIGAAGFTAKRNAFHGRRTSEGPKAPGRMAQGQRGPRPGVGKVANSTTLQFYTRQPVTREVRAPGELRGEAHRPASKLSATGDRARWTQPLVAHDYLQHKALVGGERRVVGRSGAEPGWPQTQFNGQPMHSSAGAAGSLLNYSATAARIPTSYLSFKAKANLATVSALSLQAVARRAPQDGPPDGGVYRSSRPGTGARTAGAYPRGRATVNTTGAVTAMRPSTGGDPHLPEPQTAGLSSPSPIQELHGQSLLKASREGDEVGTTDASKGRADDGWDPPIAGKGSGEGHPPEDLASSAGVNALGSSCASLGTTMAPPNASTHTIPHEQGSTEARVSSGPNATVRLGSS